MENRVSKGKMSNNTLLGEPTDKVFLKPCALSGGIPVINSHICGESDCSCIVGLKDNFILDKVVHLNLSNCKVKLLPDSLSELPLKSLDLSHNSLKSVPNCILFGLENLENLNLSHNNISEFEVEPKCVSNLQILHIEANNMKYIPIWLVHVKSKDLLEIYYSYNILGKTNESMYTEIPLYNLRKMILRDSSLSNDNIPFLKSIRTLKILDVSNTGSRLHTNSFTNYEELLDHPTWEGTMEILNLSQLNMGFFPESIICLGLLKELYLSKNALFWLPECIGCLRTLEVLDISINSLCALPSTIRELKNLHVLKLEHNRLADVKLLKDLFNLKLLDLYENELDWFELDINQYQYLDLEKNCFDASLLGTTYIEKSLHYREEYNLRDRSTGCNNEYLQDTLKSESSSENDFSEDSISSNVIPDGNYEEECWDDEKVKSHPEVTASDDEWQGYIPAQQPKNNNQNYQLSLEFLLEDLYADAD